MKKEFLKYMLIAAVALLAACSSNDEFLKENTYGKVFPDEFYRNQEELDVANNALYDEFNRMFNADYASYVVALYGSDDVTTPYSANTSYLQNDTYVREAANEDARKGWEYTYSTINIANGIIANYRKAEGAVSEETLHYYAGQAYFARAYMYFWLVRIFNEIPYVTTVREGDRTLTLSPPEEVYEHIIEDLKIAEEWLPVTWKGIDEIKANGGAFTKGAAKATLASVYLTMAGYPVKKTECYRLAKEKAAEIIARESEYGYRLLDHYADLWKVTPYLHDEMIFSIMYHNVTNHNVRAPKECRPVQFGGWEAYCPEINFFRRFPAGERRNVTFVTEFPLTSGWYQTEPTLPWPEGKPMLPWEQMMFKHPYYFKMWEAEGLEGENKWKPAGDSEWYSGRTNQVIRYAEVLLIYAEAQAMADGAPDALAYECVNRVRNRAFAGVGTRLNDLKPGLGGEAFRDSVFVERGWEFAGFEYASRWFDLVRRELVEDAASANPEHSFLPGRSQDEWEIKKELLTHDSYFLPIPEEDALLNPNLK
ncbi:MAG: RagB/SusD family nutrient uptake outer membrane protein [Tannerella sp.]|jgi:major membrane immunogen (membrane-anchored lipoprotein)|nr:RagB/SusD family nutrient uptake outer membrane protein [Tannerella sp.]